MFDLAYAEGALLIVCVSTGTWVSFSNPADDNITVTREARATEVVVPKGKHVIDERNYCVLCKVHVYVFSFEPHPLYLFCVQLPSEVYDSGTSICM